MNSYGERLDDNEKKTVERGSAKDSSCLVRFLRTSEGNFFPANHLLCPKTLRTESAPCAPPVIKSPNPNPS